MELTSLSGWRPALAAALISASLAGCVSLPAVPTEVRPIAGPPVRPNPTPYSAALVCMADWGARHRVKPPTVAVGRVLDLSGRLDENGGRALTQGAALMTVSALGKAGIPVVERFETDVSRLEYALANNKLIEPRPGEAAPGAEPDYRPILPGQVAAADYFVTGGITEINANIRRNTAGVTLDRPLSSGRQGALTAQSYVLSLGLDLRLVDTTTLRVADMVSYQKQVVGRQVGANLFAFFGGNVLNASASGIAEEPTHFAIRALVERAVLEFVAGLYGAPGPQVCLSPAADPLAEKVVSAG